MKKNKELILVSAVFVGFFGYWVYVALRHLQGESNTAQTFAALYGVMALIGGIIGLRVSKAWGGSKSLIGRSLLFIALGLLFQEIGQLTYSAYSYLFHVNIPYPSLGDIGYFGSVLFYIAGALSLKKALSVQKVTQTTRSKVWVFVIPLAILGLSYYVFLKGYSFDFHHPLTVFLDFGYPLGQAFYISIALTLYVLSSRYLGGIMKPLVILLLSALALQYASDFLFLYQTSNDTWKTAGFDDLLYLASYFVMTISLIKFGKIMERIRQPVVGNE
jgi:hypothetical protein